MTQYIYLIKCQQFFKIGVANDIQSRLAQLSTGNPFELEVIALYGFGNAQAVETAIHQRFSNYRRRGEWFELTEKDVLAFHTICGVLGGMSENSPIADPTVEDLEEAEEVGEYSPTIEDVKRIINDSNYRLEYRYDKKGLRGFAWRLRYGDRECQLFIGKSNTIFEEVRKLLPEYNTGTQAKRSWGDK